MKKRASLSKRTRFEIFKRDCFSCQYCGASPPYVVLHLDHIQALSTGGSDTVENLITACSSCNGGKSNVPLSSIPKSIDDLSKETREREDQINGYYEIMKEKRERIEKEVWEIVDIYSGQRKEISSKIFNSIKMFIGSLDFYAVLDAMELAVLKKGLNSKLAFLYFCGICWNRIKAQQNG